MLWGPAPARRSPAADPDSMGAVGSRYREGAAQAEPGLPEPRRVGRDQQPPSRTRKMSRQSVRRGACLALLSCQRAFWGLLEPDARKACQSGSEGGRAQQCARPTRQQESANDQLKTHLRGPGKVLRSRLPDLVHQEIWAWLIVHYAIAVLISRAAEAADIDPDRISFTRTLRLVRRTATGTADEAQGPGDRDPVGVDVGCFRRSTDQDGDRIMNDQPGPDLLVDQVRQT